MHRPADWLPLFSTRADRPLPDVTPPPLPPARRAAVAASLARFQRGEAGEGRIAREVRALPLPPAHRDAIGLFVREEGRHSRLLAAAVRALGGELVASHWSDALFVAVRRALSPRRAGAAHDRRALAAFHHKIAVLLAAEVIGRSYYRALAAQLAPSALADALTEIARDEDDHLAFHRAALADRPLARAVSAAAAFVGAALVALNHRAALAPGPFLAEVARALREALQRPSARRR